MQYVSVKLDGLKKGQLFSSAKAIVLMSDDLEAENSIDHPNRIQPLEVPLQIVGNVVAGSLPAYSFAVVVVR